jgi:hypothetical protein
MSYSVVNDYINDVRTLLQDEIVPYRYSDTELVVALNAAFLEGRRLRPDLFWPSLTSIVQQFSANDQTQVYMEEAFQLAFVFGTVAHAMKRDQEDVNDERALMFMSQFEQILVGVSSVPTPAPTSQQQRR